MNGKTATVGFVICVLVSFAVLEHGRAASQPARPAAKIGVVSMTNVFKNSKKHSQYSNQAMARQARVRTQLDDLRKEAEGEEAELKTFKPGTDDYAKQLLIVLEKRSKLQTQQEFVKQQALLEDKQWLEELYQAFAKATKDLAREKGLDLVLERTEPEFPIRNEELMTTLYMHKVIYSEGCVDLTNEVIARVDANEALRP